MLKIGLLTLFKQFPTQKVAGMISFSYICKQKTLSAFYTFRQKVLSVFYTFKTRACEMAKLIFLKTYNPEKLFVLSHPKMEDN